MKKHAVLITVLFTLSVTLVSVSAVFWEFYKLNKWQYIDHIFTKYSVIVQIYKEHQQKMTSDVMLDANLAVYKLQIIKDEKQAKKLLKKAKLLKDEGFKNINSAVHLSAQGLYTTNTISRMRVKMFEYKKTIYFEIEGPNGYIVVRDDELVPYKNGAVLYTYSVTLAVIVFSFILILQKLRPLIRLRRKIARFGNGDLSVSFKTSSCDEIGMVANEIEATREKIEKLLESRTLFLRNIMHELKTPIAKGTIATQMLDSPKQRERFSSIFSRLEALVNEFAMIEEVTSESAKGDFHEYRLVDIIDGAIDMAMVDSANVTVQVSAEIKMEANYRLYTTAIKNMIDNAMKYSTNQHITIAIINNELCFDSKGERLAHKLEFYIEPFTKENPSKNSFGLGLYLVDSILKAHDQVLAYEYHDGVNRFIFA